MKSICAWPEVFTNPDFEYNLNDSNVKNIALADGLTGWGNSYLERHPGVGKGMVKIDTVLGVEATEKNLKALAVKWTEIQE